MVKNMMELQNNLNVLNDTAGMRIITAKKMVMTISREPERLNIGINGKYRAGDRF